jgi:drug/metabolite transporter (DMT)-like permease
VGSDSQALKLTAPAANRRGVLLVTASAVAWSAGGLFTRLLTLDNWTMSAWRGLFGAFGIAVILLAQREFGGWRALRFMGWPGWLFVLQSAVGMIFYLAALRHTTVANVAVIYATTPLLGAALSWVFLRERPARTAVFGTVLALVGVAIMVGFAGVGGLLGDLFALGMTLSMAVATVVARNFRTIPILETACLSSLLSGLICWPLGTPLAVSGHEIGILALFGIVNFAIGLPLFTLGARLLPVIETSLIGSLDAPLAPLWVWLAFNETPGPATLIGGAIVFVAVGVHLVAASRES